MSGRLTGGGLLRIVLVPGCSGRHVFVTPVPSFVLWSFRAAVHSKKFPRTRHIAGIDFFRPGRTRVNAFCPS